MNSGVGERLKYIRDHFQLDQTQFAESLGIRQPNYSLIENNQSKGLSDRFKRALKRVYNVNLEYVLTGEGKAFLGPPRVYAVSEYYVESLENTVKKQKEKIKELQEEVNLWKRRHIILKQRREEMKLNYLKKWKENIDKEVNKLENEKETLR
jgi:transcriptional regulator with XRE-family HTH domain